MEISHVVTMAGTGVAVSAFIYNVLRNFREDMKKEFHEIKMDIKEIKHDIKSMDQRLSRLEGLERGHFEGRMYSLQRNITEEKK